MFRRYFLCLMYSSFIASITIITIIIASLTFEWILDDVAIFNLMYQSLFAALSTSFIMQIVVQKLRVLSWSIIRLVNSQVYVEFLLDERKLCKINYDCALNVAFLYFWLDPLPKYSLIFYFQYLKYTVILSDDIIMSLFIDFISFNEIILLFIERTFTNLKHFCYDEKYSSLPLH